MFGVLAVFLPLIGAACAGLGGRWLGPKGAMGVTCALMTLSALCGIELLANVAFGGHTDTIQLFTWISSGTFEADWAIRLDQLSAVMVFVVSLVSTAVHYYSIGYMAHDRSRERFFAYLSLFTFFMLSLVTSDNFLQMFFGWEGVGLCSYFLIGFWYDRPSANAAAIKAFLVNRVGDFGFALGIMGVFFVFDTISFDPVFAAVPAKAAATFHFLSWNVATMPTLCLLLFVGAMGKSAQVPLHTWLPDAMEGPTPVSALIHAATMVTAGVFMVARLSPMFEYAPDALMVVAVIGATTAFFAATIGMCQNDIKRVIAYSTCSQLGYMFFACGVSAYAAGIFHLMTHAFFKALLFLGAGSVIHAMSDEQDMRRMGGLGKHIKLTCAVMWIGSLALAGIPPFAGYWSKDTIIEAAFGAGGWVGAYAFWMGVAAAFMTAFYSWRLLFMTFHGQSRVDAETMHHVHESPKVMTVPLLFLALGAVIAGWLGYEWFVGDDRAAFWGKSILVLPQHDTIAAAHQATPVWVQAVTLVVAFGGIAVAWYYYMKRTDLPARTASWLGGVYRFVFNKWYFDELYDAVFVRTAHVLGRGLWKEGDGAVIDGCGPDGIAAAARDIAAKVSRLQSGYVYHYAFAMLVGVFGLVSWYLWSGG